MTYVDIFLKNREYLKRLSYNDSENEDRGLSNRMCSYSRPREFVGIKIQYVICNILAGNVLWNALDESSKERSRE
jgi:hypothetical protein